MSNYTGNPNIAKTMIDMVSPRQLVAIRAISRSQRVDGETVCLGLLQCKPEELSRKAASALIDYLKSAKPETVARTA